MTQSVKILVLKIFELTFYKTLAVFRDVSNISDGTLSGKQ